MKTIKFTKRFDALLPNDQEAVRFLANLEDRELVEFHVVERQRTKKQNNTIHRYLRALVHDLNEAGLDMRTVLKPEVEIPWTEESAKEFLWRPIMKILFDIESTCDMTTDQVNEVYQILSRHLATKFAIQTTFTGEPYA